MLIIATRRRWDYRVNAVFFEDMDCIYRSAEDVDPRESNASVMPKILAMFNEIVGHLRRIFHHRPQGLVFVIKRHPNTLGNASHNLARNLDRSRIVMR